MLSSSDDSELWHVAFSTEDVRVWSLDQLNDAFRFDVVTAGTLVQKHGSKGWQRLGVMAGIEPEGTPNGSPAPSEQAVARALRDAGLSAQPSIPAPMPISYAPPPSFAPVAFGATALAAPSPFQTSSGFSTSSRKRGSSGTGWLLAAMILGALPVLYRNDLLLSAAQRADRQAQYLSLEKSWLGGPAYGTPRQLAARFPSDAPAAPSSDTTPAPAALPAPPAPASTSIAASAAASSSAHASPASGNAVSLDALPVESPAAAAARPAAPAAPVAARAASPTVKASTPVQLDEKPAKRAAPAKVEEPVPSDPLKAAIFTAVKNEQKKK